MTPSPSIAYGIDYAGSDCTVVRAKKRGRTISFETLVAGKNPTDPAVASVFAAISAEQQTGHAIVTSAAPTQDSIIRLLQSPFPSVTKARSVLPSLLDVQLPFPLEQCVCHFVLAPQPRGENIRATAVAIPAEHLGALIENNRRAGFDPDIIDAEAIALWRFARPHFTSDASRCHTIVYMGLDRTAVVFGRGGDPSASFGARTGWRDDTDPTALDKLTVRIRQFLAGAIGTSGNTDPDFIVCGPRARHGMTGLMARLEVPASRHRLVEHAESWYARALASSALLPDPWSVNLRTGTMEHPNQQQRAREADRGRHVVLRLAAVLLIAVSLGASALIRRQHTGMQQRVQASARELTGAPTIPRGQELFIAEQFIVSSAERYRAYREWFEPTAYPLFARIMTAALQAKQQLETVSVRADAILVRGSGTDWNDPDRLAQPMQQDGWSVEIEREEAGRDERVHYTVRAKQ